MNILFLSHLTNEISQGPNYSVPARIFAQSKYDNVFWWNLTDAKQDFWVKTGLFHNITDYSEKTFTAPLILVPMTIERPKVSSPFTVYWNGDEIRSNLSLMMQHSFLYLYLISHTHMQYYLLMLDIS